MQDKTRQSSKTVKFTVPWEKCCAKIYNYFSKD